MLIEQLGAWYTSDPLTSSWTFNRPIIFSGLVTGFEFSKQVAKRKTSSGLAWFDTLLSPKPYKVTKYHSKQCRNYEVQGWKTRAPEDNSYKRVAFKPSLSLYGFDGSKILFPPTKAWYGYTFSSPHCTSMHLKMSECEEVQFQAWGEGKGGRMHFTHLKADKLRAYLEQILSWTFH